MGGERSWKWIWKQEFVDNLIWASCFDWWLCQNCLIARYYEISLRTSDTHIARIQSLPRSHHLKHGVLGQFLTWQNDIICTCLSCVFCCRFSCVFWCVLDAGDTAVLLSGVRVYFPWLHQRRVSREEQITPITEDSITGWVTWLYNYT